MTTGLTVPGGQRRLSVPPWAVTVLPYLAVVLSFGLGLWQKWPCHAAGWPYQPDLIFGRLCYSDLPVLYHDRGLAEGFFPYATAQSLEYPVLSGYVMDLTARTVFTGPAFFLVNLVVLLVCALVTVWAVVALTGRVSAGLLVALAPVLALTGTINWDLLAVMFATLALLAWARERPALAGLAIGLGTAAKLYPVLLLFPILLLAYRSRRWRPAVLAAVVALASWILVNAPVALLYPAGWAKFFQFNADRGAEFGSAFYALGLLDSPLEPLNTVAMLLLLACLLLITCYALSVRATPSMQVLSLLTVAAFLVTNKVYSPQYVLWLLPLAVLAGARLSVLILWQLAEVAYWYAVWGHLSGSVGTQTYAHDTFVRIIVELFLCASVLIELRRTGRLTTAATPVAGPPVPAVEPPALPDGQLVPGEPVLGDGHPARLEKVQGGVAG